MVPTSSAHPCAAVDDPRSLGIFIVPCIQGLGHLSAKQSGFIPYSNSIKKNSHREHSMMPSFFNSSKKQYTYLTTFHSDLDQLQESTRF